MKKKTNQEAQKQLDELVEVAKSAVIGYEKYLLDKLNYKDLARIMKNMRKVLEDNNNFDDKENNL